MKKIYRLISAAIFCAMLVASVAMLSSCGKISSAATLSRINNAMEKLDSYEMSININVKYYLDGKAVDYKSEGTTIVAGLGKSNFYYYSLAETELTSEKLDIDQSTMLVEAYKDGVYYLRNKADGRSDIKLCGKMGIEKFKTYINPQRHTVVNLNDCKKVKTSKNSDGTRTIEYSGYSEESLSAIADSFGADEYLFGYDISDVKVTVVYDGDYRIKQLSYSFSFDAEEGQTPVLSIWTTYSNYNAAERTDQYIKPSGYKELDNIGVLNDVAIALDELMHKDSSAFKFDLEQTVSYVGNKAVHKESNTVKYGTKNGKFYYEIDALVSDKKTNIKYQNGKQTVNGSGSPSRNIDSDSEARAFIMQMMNPTSLVITNVYDVVSLGNDVYEFKCFTDKTACYELFSQYDATFSTATHTVRVTVSPYGTLTKMESELKIEGYVSSKNSRYGLGITIKAVNEYDVDVSSSSSKGDTLSIGEYSIEK